MTSVTIDRTDGLNSAAAIKGPCRVATTANITLSGEQTIDGVAVVTGDRVLVKDQTSGSENGVYAADTGPWRRAKDFNKTKDVVEGTLVYVTQGAANAWRIYRITTAGPISVGTTAISFGEAFATSARSINAGTGLTGGGDLSQDRTIALNNASIASLALADTSLQGPDLGYPLAQLGLPTLHVSGEWDWTTVINNALAAGKRILLPEGSTGVTGITVIDKSVITGVHRQNSVLKLLNGSNKHIISTANFDALWNTADTNIAPKGIVLHKFTIDGNRANNTVGCGIAMYARLFSIVNIDLKNIPDDGIKCDYRDSASGPITFPNGAGMLGMEAEFRWIGMDNIGGYGMWMRGPHDSYLEHIHVIHASQKAANTYDPFRFEPTFTARGNNLHCYNSGLVANHRYGIYDAAGCDIINSHFEGSASANVYVKAQRSLYDNIRAYATRNAPYNVIIGGNQNQFRGFLGGKASGVDCIGIRLGLDGSDSSAQNIIDVIIVDNNGGSVDFSLSQGGNKITVRGDQSSGSVIISNPQLSDTLDILVSGVRYTNSRNSLTATGTTAADALQLLAPINRVTTVAANTGVKLPPAASLTGTRVLVINAGANPLKVYPNGSDSIEYVGFPASVTVPTGKTASFEAAFSNLWEPIISA